MANNDPSLQVDINLDDHEFALFQAMTLLKKNGLMVTSDSIRSLRDRLKLAEREIKKEHFGHVYCLHSGKRWVFTMVGLRTEWGAEATCHAVFSVWKE